MRDSDELPYVVIERHSGSLAAFVWGALLGAGVALLMAPRSGAQTQEEIRQGVRRVRTAAEDRVESARSTVNRTRSRIEDQLGNVREQLGTVKERIDSRADRAREALDNGRRVARDARAELERRMADMRDGHHSTAERFGTAQAGDSGSSQTADLGADVVTDASSEWTEGPPDLA
jgi:gas vesicle protein